MLINSTGDRLSLRRLLSSLGPGIRPHAAIRLTLGALIHDRHHPV